MRLRNGKMVNPPQRRANNYPNKKINQNIDPNENDLEVNVRCATQKKKHDDCVKCATQMKGA